MAITFPTTLDALTNPTSTDLLENAVAALDHDVQHSNANDAIEALEAKVGINSSAVTTSHDYKLGEVTGTDKAVGKTATQVLTNKTLTAPQINFGSDARGDIMVRNSSGVSSRLPIGTSGQILQSNASGDPEWIANPAAADASTTVKGVVEEATQAEYDAGTAAGGTSARLFANPSTIRARLLNTGVVDTGSADTIAIAPSPAITAYAVYQEFTFKAAATNTGATTINVNALGTKNVFNNGAACTGGEIVSGNIYTVVYDGTQFMLTSQVSKPLVSGKTGVSSSSSGTVTITHGLGRTPTIIRIKGMGADPNSNTQNVSISMGSYSGGSQSCIYWQVGTTGNGGGTFSTSAFSVMLQSASATGNYQSGVIGNITSTGFDVVWTTVGTGGSGVWHWEIE